MIRMELPVDPSKWPVEPWLTDLFSDDEDRQRSAIEKLVNDRYLMGIVQLTLRKFLSSVNQRPLFDEIWGAFELRLIQVAELVSIMRPYKAEIGDLARWLSRCAVYHARDSLKSKGVRDRMVSETHSRLDDSSSGTSDPLANAVAADESEVDGVPRELQRGLPTRRSNPAPRPREFDRVREAIRSVDSRARRAVAVLYYLKFVSESKQILATWSDEKLLRYVSNVMYREHYDLVLDVAKSDAKGSNKEAMIDHRLDVLNSHVEQRNNAHRAQLKSASDKVGAKNFLVRQELNNAIYLRKQLHALGIDEGRLFAIEQWASAKTLQQISDTTDELVKKWPVVREYCRHYRRLQERRNDYLAAIRNLEKTAGGGPMPNNEEMAEVLGKRSKSVGEDLSRVTKFIVGELERLYQRKANHG